MEWFPTERSVGEVAPRVYSVLQDAEQRCRQAASAPLAMGAAYLNTDQLLRALIKVLLQPANGIGQGFIDTQVAAVELRVRLAETINQSKTPIGQR